MREILVSNLVKELLGPRTGQIDETLDSHHMPITEFTTGILSPVDEDQSKTVRDNQIDGTVQTDTPIGKPTLSSVQGGFQGETFDDSEVTSMVNPALNPQKTSSSMGISFQAASDTTPEFEICLTWAKYLPTVKQSPDWKRYPRFVLLTLQGDVDSYHFFNSLGKKCSKDDAEISFHLKSKSVGKNTFLISLFFVNQSTIPEDADNKSQFAIFQPQIRIVKKGNVKIIPMVDTSYDPESSKTELLYKNRQFYARGHMTSAVWKDIDPEIMDDDTKAKFPDAVDALGFSWADRKIIPNDKVTPFLTPDLRTEYIPMYSILSPKIKWGIDDDKPEFSAKVLSQMWDSKTLNDSLQPIVRQYMIWISDLKKVKNGKNDQIVDKIIAECTLVLERIESGIKLLVKDDDARLAFCFANMAINLQTFWREEKNFDYRPFQIAFILMTIESIISKDSPFRDTCDLLWVPTGGGKTEAYLVLVAIDMAYRRLKAIKNGKSGAGVSVFTRYTLRLLTIQQFRRSLSMFTAAEFLRVENLNSTKPVGWRPDGCPNTDEILWGSTPFSAGLWVGTGVTPNKLDDSGKIVNGRYVPIPGALNILKQKVRGEGEPAQILNCPTCNNILAIPSNGIDPDQESTIKLIIQSDSTAPLLTSAIATFPSEHIKIISQQFSEINPNYFVFEIKFKNPRRTDSLEMNYFWKKIENHLNNKKMNVVLQSTSAARPGYFFKKYRRENAEPKEYDFEIFCTNSLCHLHKDWFAGSPMGGVNGTFVDPSLLTNTSENITLNDGNNLVEVQKCFMDKDFVSDRIPIPAMTVDDQIYKNLPTMVVATVDKFARLPFEPRAAGLFGNVEYCHMLHGYYRVTEVKENGDDKHREPTGRSTKYYRSLSTVEIPGPPDFIIQDELHLIEGPLGSMVGLYESCVDFLSNRQHKIKYIASTATIKRGSDQVKSVFSRELQVFPPSGVDVDDRFFIVERKEPENHPLHDNESGRLYLGVLAPGKGALTPIVRIWARLAQTAFENKTNPEIDRFWTLVGYFNAIRELGGATSLYRQDIPQRIRQISVDSRPLFEPDKVELSGRTESDQLPSILDTINTSYPKAVDALFTTSMFGTGVDVQRLGLMLVNGQPKTTSAYIQSTGRVGRKKGALVVVYHRATRPRDLSHYEYFIRHHVQIHRTVESPTVYPFSPGAVDRALGPILVGMLRNMRNPATEWQKKNSAILMKDDYANSEMDTIIDFIENRAQNQPTKRRPTVQTIYYEMKSNIHKWRDLATLEINELEYWTFDKKEPAVVLGDLVHERDDAKDAVFSNSPTSLRTLEGETGFGK